MPTETAFLDKDHNFAQPEKARYFVRTESDAQGRVIDEVWVRLDSEPDSETIKRAHLGLLHSQRRWLWLSGAGIGLMLVALTLAATSLVGPGVTLLIGALGTATSFAALVGLRR
jgi:hypothetical protein